MNITWSKEAWAEYLYWQQTDKKQLKRINELIKDISHDPFGGIGKAEPLQHDRSGYWLRRIDKEHRFVYKISAGNLYIAQCRYHY